jgi:hypothetical protein
VDQNRYDVIIVGAGLAGRIAAYLLACRGRRVCALLASPDDVPATLPCTRPLEHLLTLLGAPAEDRRPAEPFQLITPTTRLDFNGRRSLSEELQREFPSSHSKMESCLQLLNLWGQKLETLLLRGGNPPSLGLTGRLRFYRRLWGAGLAGKKLGGGMAAFAAGIADTNAQQALLALFGGLSLQDPARLAVAEATLLWHGAGCRRVGGVPNLLALLEQRLRQLRGRTEPLAALATLQAGKKRLQAALLKDGRRLEADHFLIDQIPDRSVLPEALAAGRTFKTIETIRWRLTGLDRSPSALLARRVLLAGNPPLQLGFPLAAAGSPEAVVEFPSMGSVPLHDADLLRRRLQPVLPFITYDLSCQRQTICQAETRGSTPFPDFFGPRKIGPNTFAGPVIPASGLMAGMAAVLQGWLMAEALAPG